MVWVDGERLLFYNQILDSESSQFGPTLKNSALLRVPDKDTYVGLISLYSAFAY